MSSSSHAQLLRQLQHLITKGAKVADAIAGTPASEIHNWVEQAQSCLTLLKDTIPVEFAHFERFRKSLEFKVKDESIASKSAYVLDGPDELVDFRFENLLQANGILKVAAEKVVTLINLAESSSKDVVFDVGLLKRARKTLDVTQAEAAVWFDVTERTFKRWEGCQGVMRRGHHRRLEIFVQWARKGNKGLPPNVT